MLWIWASSILITMLPKGWFILVGMAKWDGTLIIQSIALFHFFPAHPTLIFQPLGLISHMYCQGTREVRKLAMVAPLLTLVCADNHYVVPHKRLPRLSALPWTSSSFLFSSTRNSNIINFHFSGNVYYLLETPNLLWY